MSLFAAAAMIVTSFVSSATGYAASNEGKILNIYCWNEEFKGIFEAYASDLTKAAGITVNWIITPTDNGEYQDSVDDALTSLSKTSANRKIDLFLVEPDYSAKYTNSGYVLPVSQLGVTEDDMKYQYPFTKDLMRSNGKVMGVTWNACSGVFVYRRSIAKKVLGTDDPVKVQKYVKNWNNFDNTAAKMAKKGYYMLASAADTYRPFSQNSETPWVTGSKITIGTARDQWVKQTVKYSKNSYNYMAPLWTDDYAEQISGNGVTFGSFWPQWGVDYIVGIYGEDNLGDYAVCEGPAAYYWGGTYMCAVKGTDNKSIIGKIMKRLTCNSSTMYKYGKTNMICVNNTAAMKKLANTKSMSSALLGGQNPYVYYHKSALKANGKNLTMYDQYLDDCFMNNMVYYANGTYTKKDALTNFYDLVAEAYPKLKH